VKLDSVYPLIQAAIDKGIALEQLYEFTFPALIDRTDVKLDSVYPLIQAAINKKIALEQLYEFTFPALIKRTDVKLDSVYPLIQAAIDKKIALEQLYQSTILKLLKKENVDLNKVYELISQAFDKGIHLDSLYKFTIPALIERSDVDLNKVYELISQAFDKGIHLDSLYKFTIPALIERSDVDLNEVYELISQAFDKGIHLDSLYKFTIPALIERSDVDLNIVYYLIDKLGINYIKGIISDISTISMIRSFVLLALKRNLLTWRQKNNKQPALNTEDPYDAYEGCFIEAFNKILEISRNSGQLLNFPPCGIGMDPEYELGFRVYLLTSQLNDLKKRNQGQNCFQYVTSMMCTILDLKTTNLDRLYEYMDKETLQSLCQNELNVLYNDKSIEVKWDNNLFYKFLGIVCRALAYKFLYKPLPQVLSSTDKIMIQLLMISGFVYDHTLDSDTIYRITDFFFRNYKVTIPDKADKPVTGLVQKTDQKGQPVIVRLIKVPPNSPAYHLAAHIAHACYAGVVMPPNIDVVNIEAIDRKNPSRATIKGNFLVIRTTDENDDPVAILRAINPNENFSRDVDQRELLNLIVSYVRTNYKGYQVGIIIESASAMASTNRPKTHEALRLLNTGKNPIIVKPDSIFNGYNLSGMVFPLLKPDSEH
jgi:hypothetical protein